MTALEGFRAREAERQAARQARKDLRAAREALARIVDADDPRRVAPTTEAGRIAMATLDEIGWA